MLTCAVFVLHEADRLFFALQILPRLLLLLPIQNDSCTCAGRLERLEYDIDILPNRDARRNDNERPANAI